MWLALRMLPSFLLYLCLFGSTADEPCVHDLAAIHLRSGLLQPHSARSHQRRLYSQLDVHIYLVSKSAGVPRKLW